MSVSFVGFDLGSYLLGVVTPLMLVFVWAVVVSIGKLKK